MCRNIRTLFNFEPPASDEEIRAAALPHVRKVSGSTAPSAANRPAFDRAVEEVAEISRRRVRSELQEVERAKERGQKRDAQQRVRLLSDFRQVE